MSYFANGLNAKDIAKPKFIDYDVEYITFERSKIERCLKSDPRPITIFVNDDLKLIFKQWGNPVHIPNKYIFPVLTQGITPLREYALIQNFVGLINEWMKNILFNLGIKKKSTTYVARHPLHCTQTFRGKYLIYSGGIWTFRHKNKRNLPG